MPSVEFIEFGLNSAATVAEDLKPSIQKAFADDIPEIFAGKGKEARRLFRHAVSLAPDDLVREQLLLTRKIALQLSRSRIENLRPSGLSPIFTQTSAADLIDTNRHRLSGFLRVELLSSNSKTYIDRIPVQLISASLFNTVPTSAGWTMILRRELFAEADVFDRSTSWFNSSASYFKKSESATIDEENEPETIYEALAQGSPMRVVASTNAGATIQDELGNVSKLIEVTNFSTTWRKALQEAIIDREVIGDVDCNPGNLTIEKTAARPTIGNIDIEVAFRAESQPELRGIFSHPVLLRQKLEPTIAKRAGRFVETYGTATGRQLLENLQMKAPAIDGVLNRAQWFADNQSLPTRFDSIIDCRWKWK